VFQARTLTPKVWKNARVGKFVGSVGSAWATRGQIRGQRGQREAVSLAAFSGCWDLSFFEFSASFFGCVGKFVGSVG
jgi:hypothetical protein